MPDTPLTTYSERALTRQNRRTRPDRATLALVAIAQRPAVRSAFVHSALESLGDEEPGVGAEACRLLAREQAKLDEGSARTLLEAYDSLSPVAQRELAPEADVGALGRFGTPSPKGLAEKRVSGAPDKDVEARLSRLLEIWLRDAWSPEDASVALGAFALRVDGLAQPDATLEALLETTGNWLGDVTERSATRKGLRSLCSWERFPSLALGRFESFWQEFVRRPDAGLSRGTP